MNAAVSWIDARRAEAAERFRALGVPHRRIEEWKYTDLKTALDSANDTDALTIAWTFATVPAGVELFDLSDLTHAPDWVQAHFGKAATGAMSAASLATARTGFAVRVPKNVTVSELLNVAFSGAGHARALFVLEEGAALTLHELRKSDVGFSNIGIEVVLGANAHFTHIRVADAAPKAIQVEDVAIRVARDASYRAHLMSCGASLSRLTLRMTLKEAGANAQISGVSVLGDNLHADLTTEIYHAAGQTQSTQLFKQVVGGKARAVYQGKITVAQGADKSDSRQTAKALLLSERAEADLKPELEIYADDVKCAHGAAVGDLDADSLFYLRSRGIPEAEARNILLRAFLEEAVAEIANETLRAAVWRGVEEALPRAMAGTL
jgi:Fe-S cluster assembly protein SufD